jgi:hypothetical protein
MSLYNTEQRTTFLGTLASGHLSGEALPAEFLELAERFNELYALYEAREITRDQLAGQLRKLRVFDRDDFEWTIGATTRAWYRRTVDGGWITAPPPSLPVRRSSAPVDPLLTTRSADVPTPEPSAPATEPASAPPKGAALILEDLDDDSALNSDVAPPGYGF